MEPRRKRDAALWVVPRTDMFAVASSSATATVFVAKRQPTRGVSFAFDIKSAFVHVRVVEQCMVYPPHESLGEWIADGGGPHVCVPTHCANVLGVVWTKDMERLLPRRMWILLTELSKNARV